MYWVLYMLIKVMVNVIVKPRVIAVIIFTWSCCCLTSTFMFMLRQTFRHSRGRKMCTYTSVWSNHCSNKSWQDCVCGLTRFVAKLSEFELRMLMSECQKRNYELVVGLLFTTLDGHFIQSGKVIAYTVNRLLWFGELVCDCIYMFSSWVLGFMEWLAAAVLLQYLF
jgi:hypothetical protein